MIQDAADLSATIVAPPRPSVPQPTVPWPSVFDTGSEGAPQGQLPGPAVFSRQEALNALNPLQYVPIAGMVYRQATGETIPPPLAIAGSVVSGAISGGPLGVLGSVLLNFVMELARIGPDLSRPPVPEGMDQTGSEAGIRPVSPGSIATPGGYASLATTLPDWLGGPRFMLDGTPAQHAVAAYEAGSAIGAG